MARIEDSIETLIQEVQHARKPRRLPPSIYQIDELDPTVRSHILVEGCILSILVAPHASKFDQFKEALEKNDQKHLHTLLEASGAQLAKAASAGTSKDLHVKDLPIFVDVFYDTNRICRSLTLLPGQEVAAYRSLWDGGQLDREAFAGQEYPRNQRTPSPHLILVLVAPKLSKLERAILDRIPADMRREHIQSAVSPYANVVTFMATVVADDIVRRAVDWAFGDRDKDQNRNNAREQEVVDRQARDREQIDQRQEREEQQVEHRQQREDQQIQQRHDQQAQDIQQRQDRERQNLQERQARENERVMDNNEREAQQNRHQQEQEQQERDHQAEAERQQERQRQEQERLNQQHQQERDRKAIQDQQERDRQQKEQEQEQREQQQQGQGGGPGFVPGRGKPELGAFFENVRGMPFDYRELQRRLGEIDFESLDARASAQTLLKIRQELVRKGLS